MSRLRFESQRTRLNTQFEYEQEQLNKLHSLINKIKDFIKSEEDAILMLKKVILFFIQRPYCLIYVSLWLVKLHQKIYTRHTQY